MNRTNSCYAYYIRSSILSLSLLYTLDIIKAILLYCYIQYYGAHIYTQD